MMAKDDAEVSPAPMPAKVSPVVGRLRQIEQVWQLQGEFHRLPVPVHGAYHTEFAIFQTDGEIADDASELVATVRLGCRLTAEVEDTSEIPEEFLDKEHGRVVIAFVHGSYMITYGLKEGGGLSDEDVADFCARNGVHTAWPFWREFVTSSLMRSGLEAVPVPPFTIFGPPNPAVTSKPDVAKPRG